MLVIPSHNTHKNDVSERNVCLLLSCEGSLALIDILVTENSSLGLQFLAVLPVLYDTLFCQTI